MDTARLKSLVESLVFASELPLKPDRIAEILECEKSKVSVALKELVVEHQERKGGICLVEVADGFQFRTPQENGEWIQRLGKTRPFRFSRAALETLAIIGYRQPVTRAEVEYLRGVDSGGVIKTLLDKRLLRILGKKDMPGRPLLYGTSREFLELFGLKSLSELPTLKEFGELSPEEPLLSDNEEDISSSEP